MDELKILRQVLLSNYIKEYEDVIFEIIPELECEKGLEQKNECHIYDVWNHTIEAINYCDKNFEDRLVLLLHDIGKTICYQDEGNIRHFKGHAMQSMIMSKTILKRLGYKNKELEEMLLLISTHSSLINVKDITQENKEFYKRLLKIQKCDAKAYEQEHSKQALENLSEIEFVMDRKITQGDKKRKPF